MQEEEEDEEGYLCRASPLISIDSLQLASMKKVWSDMGTYIHG